MTSYLLNHWKNSEHGLLDATHFALVIADRVYKSDEQALIIEAFNDWNLLTPIWFQFVGAVENIKCLAQTDGFPAANAAWLLASKILYFLRSFDESMRCALAAGDAFSIYPTNGSLQDVLYKQKMVEHAIDYYKELRGQKTGQNDKSDKLKEQLERLVGQIFERAVAAKDYRLVIGLALECNRADLLKIIVDKESTDGSQLRTDLLFTTLEFIGKVLHDERKQTYYELVVELFGEMIFTLDLSGQNALLECLETLGRSDEIAKFFATLAKIEASVLVAYQLAFELKEHSAQRFLDKICLQLAAIEDGESEKKILNTIQSILKGRESSRFYHQFLVMRNQADLSVITGIRDSVRNACTLNAALISNGLMYMGTTSDIFLRNNLTWISTATNWNKFNTVASLGLIHRGNESNAKKILEPYLPKESEQDTFKFKEGGALYAYGLIHMNYIGDGKAISFLAEQLDVASTPVLRHGAALGLGLAACDTHDENVYAKLTKVLHLDEAVASEASAISMGMVMAASMNQDAFDEMRKFMQESQHNKIQRGLQIGCAMLAYGHVEAAEEWITGLLAAKSNAVLRQAGVWMMAMAYVGVGRPTVVKRLLDLFAMDPNQDVKRFAVIALGFVLCNDSEQCLKYTGMLVDHFNGYIRYGAAIAIGISCAGTGNRDAIAQLETLLLAKENYVRQGALIAFAMVLIQTTAGAKFRKEIHTIITTKGEDSITKFGAIVAQGILDAGGRNMTLSLHNRYGQVNMRSVLGMLVFSQHWYWHSVVYFISLALHPTCVIALTKDFRMPKIEFLCNTKQSLFAYPSSFEEKKVEVGKVETAVLSVSKKTEVAAVPPKEEDKSATKMDTTQKTAPSNYTIANPARVVEGQLKALQISNDSSRYTPLKPLHLGGIVMVQDAMDGKDEEIVEVEELTSTSGAEGGSKTDIEVEKPMPFEFDMMLY